MDDIDVKVRPDLIYVMSKAKKKQKFASDHMIYIVKEFMNFVESQYPEEGEMFTFLTNNLVQWKNKLEQDKIDKNDKQLGLF